MIIWTLGDAVVDLLPLADMQYQACAGGAPFNVAIGTARLDRQSGFIGRVGDDDFGHFLKKHCSMQASQPQAFSWIISTKPVRCWSHWVTVENADLHF